MQRVPKLNINRGSKGSSVCNAFLLVSSKLNIKNIIGSSLLPAVLLLLLHNCKQRIDPGAALATGPVAALATAAAGLVAAVLVTSVHQHDCNSMLSGTKFGTHRPDRACASALARLRQLPAKCRTRSH